ncbi:MAG: hypothetical protein A4E40_00876 [Methanoregulaceae archaeon PtaU1.Bin059]|nr:MAG: hypothetical protein A4E40_00876 [Methanoregulaceae archaeon PtaU1.Bin059]
MGAVYASSWTAPIGQRYPQKCLPKRKVSRKKTVIPIAAPISANPTKSPDLITSCWKLWGIIGEKKANPTREVTSSRSNFRFRENLPVLQRNAPMRKKMTAYAIPISCVVFGPGPGTNIPPWHSMDQAMVLRC